MSRWADEDSDPAAPVVPAGGSCELVRRRVYPLQGEGELLVQMYEASAPGAPPTRRVVFTTDAADALVLHWGGGTRPTVDAALRGGVAARHDRRLRDLRGDAAGARRGVPGRGRRVRDAADARRGPPERRRDLRALRRAVRAARRERRPVVQGLRQRIEQLPRELYLFGREARAPVTSSSTPSCAPRRAGAGGRSCIASTWRASLLEQKCSPGNGATGWRRSAPPAKAYVWLRYSSQRKLTWQRNYNVKPRELSAAQSKLTRVIAGLYCAAPHLRDTARLMLGTVGKGGGGGDGQEIRDEILNIMHRNGIGRRRNLDGGVAPEAAQQHHPGRHHHLRGVHRLPQGQRRPGRVLARLRRGRHRPRALESYERPILDEPITHGAEKKMALIKDFSNYLAILKSVHSGADLIECIRAVRRVSGGVSPALNYARVAQNGGGDAIQLLARASRRGTSSATPVSTTPRTRSGPGSCSTWTSPWTTSRAAPWSARARPITAWTTRWRSPVWCWRTSRSLPSSNQDVVLSLIDWRLAVQARRDGDSQWALRAKAVVDRARLSIARHADGLAEEMQPAATTSASRARSSTGPWTSSPRR